MFLKYYHQYCNWEAKRAQRHTILQLFIKLHSSVQTRNYLAKYKWYFHSRKFVLVAEIYVLKRLIQMCFEIHVRKGNNSANERNLSSCTTRLSTSRYYYAFSQLFSPQPIIKVSFRCVFSIGFHLSRLLKYHLDAFSKLVSPQLIIKVSFRCVF